MRRRAPIHLRHLRRIYVAILQAAHDGDWEAAGKLHKSMPLQYQAIAHLVVYHCRQAGRA